MAAVFGFACKIKVDDPCIHFLHPLYPEGELKRCAAYTAGNM
jgi:hypothetical protein